MILNYSKNIPLLWALQSSNEAELCQKDCNFFISSGSWSSQQLAALHSTSRSYWPQQRISKNIGCSQACHLTTFQLSISWMAVYVKYLFVLPEKCITHWWSGSQNKKEATSPKTFKWKREKKIWGEGKENNICPHVKCSLELRAGFVKI